MRNVFRILFFLTFEVLTDSINFVILLDGFLGFKVVGFLGEEEIFDQIPNPIFWAPHEKFILELLLSDFVHGFKDIVEVVDYPLTCLLVQVLTHCNIIMKFTSTVYFGQLPPLHNQWNHNNHKSKQREGVPSSSLSLRAHQKAYSMWITPSWPLEMEIYPSV